MSCNIVYPLPVVPHILLNPTSYVIFDIRTGEDIDRGLASVGEKGRNSILIVKALILELSSVRVGSAAGACLTSVETVLRMVTMVERGTEHCLALLETSSTILWMRSCRVCSEMVCGATMVVVRKQEPSE